ncbi:MAG TPA: hypothetical protein VFV67_33975 [Actinophytocola sp.]|uniref:hypothetical protein n=1 Tax=Actinophytocola sp. TaxID=1872138 RepID=UPI002DB6E005|nr:hypothetical protein [Actinophytocola sp.]HEU5475676.1 hypothetical protein [Actinophytocola sp.]
MNELDRLEPMTAQQCAQVLGMAAATDQRMPQPDEVVLRMWWAMLQRVPFWAAQQAIVEWYRSERYRETRDSISPADIAGWWRDRRRHEQLAEARRPAGEFDPDRIHRGVDAVVAALASSKGLDPDAAEGEAGWRRAVLAEPCEWQPCGARPGAPCTGPGGRPLVKRLAHECREVRARKAAGVSTP